MLRHFAAKQGADENSSALVEAFQYVARAVRGSDPLDARRGADDYRTLSANVSVAKRKQVGTS